MKIIFVCLLCGGLLGCSGIFDAPFVEAMDPMRGAYVTNERLQIRLRFSSPMNTVSVETNLVFRSSLFPQQKLRGAFVWHEGDTVLVFQPSTPLVGPATYYLEISGASDKHWNGLQPFFSHFSFRSSASIPRVVGNIPRQHECAEPTNIVVIFDQEMDAVSTAAAFRIAPSLSGSVFVSTNVLVFLPSAPFERGQIYTVSIMESAMSKRGGILGERHVFSFTFGANTASPVVTNVFYNTLSGQTKIISNYSRGMPKQIRSLVFEFNVPIDAASIGGNVAIEPSLSFSNRVSNNRLLIFPFTNFATGVQYTVTLRSGIRASRGSAMNQAYSFSFLVDGDNAEKVSIHDIRHGTNVWSEGNINVFWNPPWTNLNWHVSVTFSRRMNLQSLLAFVSVSFVCGRPPGEFTGSIRRISNRHGNTYDIIIDRVKNATYKITFPEGGVIDEQGNPLIRTHTYLFVPAF